MAEDSPRSAAGEDSGEEGEEATEAPLLEEKKPENSPVLQEDPETAPGTEDSNEEPVSAHVPEEKAAPVRPSRPIPVSRPLLATPPAFHLPMPTYPTIPPVYYPPAPPVLPSTAGVNVFANDGSFLELFKKKMEQTPAATKEEAATPVVKNPEPDKRKPISFVGKRRGGAKLALKTGMVVKKPKTDDDEVVVQKGGAWAQYMAEVKKYKAHQCSDDDKTRPLVK